MAKMTQYQMQEKTMAQIRRAKAKGTCPVCASPSMPWRDGTPKLTCGKRKCQSSWVLWGGTPPKKKTATPGADKRAFTAAAFLHRDADDLARGGQGLSAYAEEVAAGHHGRFEEGREREPA